MNARQLENFCEFFPIYQNLISNYPKETGLYSPVLFMLSPFVVFEGGCACGNGISFLADGSALLAYRSGPVAYRSGPLAYRSVPVAYRSGPLAYRSGPVAYRSVPLTYRSGPAADGSAPFKNINIESY